MRSAEVISKKSSLSPHFLFLSDVVRTPARRCCEEVALRIKRSSTILEIVIGESSRWGNEVGVAASCGTLHRVP